MMINFGKSKNKGFTLIEIMVVVGIIGVLATAGVMTFGTSSASSRDAKRQGDLRNLQQAIEAYKNQEGRYPAQCPTSGASANGWSGQLDTNYACTNGTGQYIVGLAPEYISVLPIDPKRPTGRDDVGYVYRTNTNRDVYKIMALNTVEADTLSYAHAFKSCDVMRDGSNDIRNAGWCAYVRGSGASYISPPDCRINSDRFQHSYALWGGIAPLATPAGGIDLFAAEPLSTVIGNSNQQDQRRATAVVNTADVICQ